MLENKIENISLFRKYYFIKFCYSCINTIINIDPIINTCLHFSLNRQLTMYSTGCVPKVMKYISLSHLYRLRHIRTSWIKCGGLSTSQYTKHQSVPNIGCVRIADLIHPCFETTSRRTMENSLSRKVLVEIISKRPSTSQIHKNVTHVRNLLNYDYRISVRLLADTLKIPKTVMYRFVTVELNMWKVCAKLVLKLLTNEKNTNRVLIASELKVVWKSNLII